jgi:hypothetical protein
VESIYTALLEGVAWAVGWGDKDHILDNRRMLFALGMTRFDLLDLNLLTNSKSTLLLPDYIYPANNSILLYRATGQQINFARIVENIPFTMMVYQNFDGKTLASVENQVNEFAGEYGLTLADIVTFTCEDSEFDNITAVLTRD